MKLVYFSWIRERIGTGEEIVELPEQVTTIAEVIAWLRTRDETYDEALRMPEAVRAAINGELVDHATTIEGANEIALFPPMTGG